MHLETDRNQLVMVENFAAVEYESWFYHCFVNPFVIQFHKLLPFRAQYNGVRVVHCRVRVAVHIDGLDNRLRITTNTRMREFVYNLFGLHLRVVNIESGPLVEQRLGDVYRGRLARVAGVLFERESKHG